MPDLCTVSGVLYDLHGNPMPGVGLRIRHLFNPVALGTTGLMMGDSKRVVSDEDGAVEFTLIQGSKVCILIPGREQEAARKITVPAQDEIDLIGLLYPTLVSLAWEDAGPLAVDVGDRVSVVVTGTYTDGTTGVVTRACTFEISDEDVLSHVSSGTFTALAAGSVTITLTEIDTDELATYQDSSGEVIPRLDLDDPTLPDALTVTAS